MEDVPLQHLIKTFYISKNNSFFFFFVQLYHQVFCPENFRQTKQRGCEGMDLHPILSHQLTTAPTTDDSNTTFGALKFGLLSATNSKRLCCELL